MPHPEILSIRAAIYGYQKEFYVWSTDQRGTDALQELVLEFESGVFCVGRAFRILQWTTNHSWQGTGPQEWIGFISSSVNSIDDLIGGE